MLRSYQEYLRNIFVIQLRIMHLDRKMYFSFLNLCGYSSHLFLLECPILTQEPFDRLPQILVAGLIEWVESIVFRQSLVPKLVLNQDKDKS